MRVAIGAILQESNPFVSAKASLEDFRKNYFEEGEPVVSRLRHTKVEIAGAIAALDAADADIVPLVATHGGAGGAVMRECFDDLLGRLLRPLRAAGTLDGVYLAMHGAMVVEGNFDAEAEILTRVREIVGEDMPVAVSCDLHANITPAMMALADIIIGYQTYPHMDTYETGERTARLLVQALKGEVTPCMRMRKAPMQVPGVRQLTSGPFPMAEINTQAREYEMRGEALAVSYFSSFSKLDAPDTGWRAVVVTDGDAAAADRLALEFVRQAWRERYRFLVPVTSLDEAIRKGLANPGTPIVLVDSSDVVGGGAAGDSAVVLRALVESRTNVSAVVLITDPDTVATAAEAGVGGSFHARIGNKLSAGWYGDPVDIDVTVERLSDGAFSTMGPTALLRHGPLSIVCCTYPSYEYADEQFLAAGVDVSSLKFIVSKTVGNFTQGFPHAAAAFVLDTPGPTTPNQNALAWKNVDRPIFPLDEDFEPNFESYPPQDIYRRPLSAA
jgi:microcystin degradation protein MlrC